MKRLLLVEDEEFLAEIILDNLEAEGYDVTWANDGRKALESWSKASPDLVLLDVMLPHVDGFEVCRRMREAGDQTPVLFLSAKTQPEDRVKGLSLGGDDYLAKPFHLPELLLRIHNMLQRQQWHNQHTPNHNVMHVGQHQVDRTTGEVMLADGRYAQLQPEELRMLTLFLQNEGRTLDRDTILDNVWDDQVFPSSRAIERLVQRLQNVFEPNPHNPLYFHKLSGIRFRYTPDNLQDNK